MTVTVASFRQNYPEFGSNALYSQSQVTYYLTIAGLLLNASRWATLLDFGTELFIAHNLSLERKAQMAAANGGVPGASVGVLNSKSVDKVSAGYDISSVMEPDAGHWNESTYGQRFIRLARMMGAGPIQIGVPAGCGDPLSSANAWIGPWPWPSMTGFSS